MTLESIKIGNLEIEVRPITLLNILILIREIHMS